MALTDKLTAIADAIREKTGKTEALTLDQMAEEISSISGDDDYFGKLLSKQLTELVSPTAAGKFPNELQQNSKVLTKVDLPLITNVGTYAFDGCSNLLEVHLPGVVEIGAATFSGCTSLTQFYLPSLQKITGWGFNFNMDGELQRVYFPKVTSIAAPSCFGGCIKLTALVLGASTVCTLDNSNALNDPMNKGAGCYIYVPAALVDLYKSATNWSVWANRFRAIEDYPEVLEGWE